LTLWFWAAYLMTTDKRGVSALLLQRQLGIRRYETAWLILHKLRRAMVNPAREPLHGQVEFDDTWIGGPQPGLRGSRQLKGRKAALVAVAVEKRGKGTGRARMEVIPDFSGGTLTDFAIRHIAREATIHTDRLKPFGSLSQVGFRHVPRKQRIREGGRPVLPRVHRAIGNLQQWLIGTYHGVSRRHLQVYLDEFVFRHNRRRQPMAAFQTLLGLGSGHPPTTSRTIRGGCDLPHFSVRR
jgi:transposase-like protein